MHQGPIAAVRALEKAKRSEANKAVFALNRFAPHVVK